MENRGKPTLLWPLLLLAILAGPTLRAQDADSDGILDGSDNCTFVYNALQLDNDTDSAGDACDCGPGCVTNLTTLGPATDFSFQSNSDLSWTQPVDTGGAPLLFDVVRSTNPADFSAAICIASDSSATLASDATPVSAPFYYLVRSDGSCGGGNLGTDSDETRRVATSCPAATALPTCTETMDSSCPDGTQVCGATFTGGGGCFVAGLGNCYDTGLRSYEVTSATPLEITFNADVNALDAFFSHDTATAGTMKFFDADNLEVDSPLMTNGDCTPGPMPPRQTIFFSRPIRKIKVSSTGGRVWIDTFTVN